MPTAPRRPVGGGDGEGAESSGMVGNLWMGWGQPGARCEGSGGALWVAETVFRNALRDATMGGCARR